MQSGMIFSSGYLLSVLWVFGFNEISVSTFAAVISTAEPPGQFLPEALCPSQLCYSSALETESNTTRWCRCDLNCEKFGDCCYDYSEKRREKENSRYQHSIGEAKAKCTYVPSLGWHLIVSSCALRSMKNPEVNWLNEQLCNGSAEVQSHFLDIPVTSATTGRTYKNIHCAACNEDADNLLPRKAMLLADGESSLEDAQYKDGTLSWVKYSSYQSKGPLSNSPLEEGSGGGEDFTFADGQESLSGILIDLLSALNQNFSGKFHQPVFHDPVIPNEGMEQDSLDEGGRNILQEKFHQAIPLKLISNLVNNASSHNAFRTLKDLLSKDIMNDEGLPPSSEKGFVDTHGELMQQKENQENISESVRDITRYWLHLSGENMQSCENLIDSCDKDWERWHDDTHKLCVSYIMPVYEYAKGMDKVFKNPHCALCNNIDFDELECLNTVQYVPFSRNFENFFPTLINFKFGNVTAGHENCSFKTVWDPLFKQCYHLNAEEENGNNSISLYLTPVPTGESSIVLKQSDSLYNENTRNMDDHCKNATLLTMSEVQWYLGYTFFGVSITCLILHLISYTYPRKLVELCTRVNSKSFYSSRTSLEGKQITGHSFLILSWLLLIGQLLFAAGVPRAEIREVCLSVAVLHNFISLAAVSWLSVFCLQVFESHFSLRSFKSMTSLESGSGPPSLKLSLIAWIIPTVFSSLCLTLELVPGDLKPCLARGGACWYGETVSFRVFFVLPALLMLAGDGCIFTAIIFGVHESSERNRSNSMRGKSKSTRRSSGISDYDHHCFRFCARLGIIMAISWSCAAVASVWNLRYMWYGFVIFSGFQGVYVFLASGSKSKITDLIWAKAKGNSEPVRRERSIKNNSKAAKNI